MYANPFSCSLLLTLHNLPCPAMNLFNSFAATVVTYTTAFAWGLSGLRLPSPQRRTTLITSGEIPVKKGHLSVHPERSKHEYGKGTDIHIPVVVGEQWPRHAGHRLGNTRGLC